MKRDGSLLRFLCGASLVAAVACQVDSVSDPVVADDPATAPQTQSEIGSQGQSVWQSQTEQAALHAWLTSERPAGVLQAPVTVTLSPAEVDAIDVADPDDGGRIKVGSIKGIPGQVAFNGGAGATATDLADGGFLWSVAVSSPGASGIRLRFAHVGLPADADLFIYNQSGEVSGPFTGPGPHGNGAFWSPSLSGDTAIVAVRYYGQPSDADLAATKAVITDIGYLGEKYMGVNTCADNADCVESAACHTSASTGWAAYETTSDAIAQLLYPSRGWMYMCSGGLLADTDPSTEIPYLLTANHCVSKGTEAKGLEATFFFNATHCATGDTCDMSPRDSQYRTLGATIVSTNRTSDYTLMRLNSQPPQGAAYMGWTAAPVAYQNGAGLHRISHPHGSPQSYSEHAVNTSKGTCTSWPRGNWIYSDDTLGATEGGSSGSPVLNDAGQVVGQLSGGCGTNVNDNCDTVNNATVDGALAAYYPQVASYLDPTPCSPSPEICDNGGDDDCDGQADCADSDCSGAPECSGGGSTCSGPGTDPVGASCTSGDTCCSGKCKGPPTGKSCR